MRGDGSVYRRGNVYWIKFYVRGVCYNMSARTENKTAAKEFLREEVLKARGTDWIPPDQRTISTETIVEDRLRDLSLAGKETHLARCRARWETYLKPFFGSMPANTIGTQQLRDYQAKRKADGAANGTINREMNVLHGAMKAAYEHEPPKLARVPKFHWLPEDNARQVFIDLDVEQKLKDAAQARGLWQRVYLEMAFTYGWRKSMLLRLRKRDVSLVNGVIHLGKTKNGDPIEAPITDGVRPILTALLMGMGPDERLFAHSELTIYREWAAICEAAGVQAGKGGIVPHDMRRSTARNNSAAGVPQHVTMQLLGWRTAGMFRRYAIVDHADTVRALRQQQEFKQGGRA